MYNRIDLSKWFFAEVLKLLQYFFLKRPSAAWWWCTTKAFPLVAATLATLQRCKVKAERAFKDKYAKDGRTDRPRRKKAFYFTLYMNSLLTAHSIAIISKEGRPGGKISALNMQFFMFLLLLPYLKQPAICLLHFTLFNIVWRSKYLLIEKLSSFISLKAVRPPTDLYMSITLWPLLRIVNAVIDCLAKYATCKTFAIIQMYILD